MWLLLAVSCSGGAAGPPPPREPVQPDKLSSYSELVRDLEAGALEGYGQLALGNVEAYADGIAHGVDLTLIGMSADAVVLGVDPPDAYGDRRIFRDREGLEIVSKNLRVNLARDESVGWTSDEVSYRIPIPVVRNGQVITERMASIPIRLTAAWVRDVDRWVQVMEHVSYPLTAQHIIDLARARRLEQPPALVAGTTGRTVDDRTAAQIRQVIEQLHGSVADPASLLVADQRSLILWPPPDQEYSGRVVAQAPSLASLFGAGAHVRITDARVSARVNTTAWACATLAVDLGGTDSELTVYLRGTYLLEARKLQGEWRWRVVQVHVSVPLSESQVEGYVFGTEPQAPPESPPPPPE
ncbi:MAG TPA: nuclear transport factor 2 family protein [Kofleriaceae bacterium]|nr:nuclear transport factor 2 family protein [Kofleriaceae bacterium]